MPDCKETQCTHCIHRSVCKFTEDYLRINEAVNDLTVTKSERDDRVEPRIRSTPIVNFDFAEVTVSCKYYEYNAERIRADSTILSGVLSTGKNSGSERMTGRRRCLIDEKDPIEIQDSEKPAP